MSGSAVVTGRCLADMANSVVGLTAVVAAGFAFGWRPSASAPAIAAALALLLMLRFAMLWVGVFFGLRARNPEAVTAVQVLVWPLLFLSSVFVDTATMPRWLGTIADANPLSATTTTVRDLFGDPGWAGGSWFAENAAVLAVAWPVLLVAVFLPLSVVSYRHLRR
jgi:ABC-2 type transport system permease protein